ncbi:UDP-N-acetylglucosamine-N-acetylmuramylpentapeptide N-acetylglucosamine transferase [Stella humosa]|uniref:UDP-N-acetylglucosamine--N-acetylmuramyl-(pentapeptide) pyrophosphoryl-undecaprenol N-acetylglucosamine transferase n=1 Tax=Stella humosa TaxID=94 RepID=A0A3N1L3Y9_9PROT|nr:undecaprenyldiphospho-muramoylpentapeptide beta-N-acetylglucosaminyltransferase [Stella humosa]ROP84115.1 UDP-N-acetylglucosamine-N-acetylmuramylpentapeptide N-acetylglucosamine transferase [Stella humosa]BBK33626.1 UDP-N-acetylglucosamine--N-acetylmuramyl-(pentapeptide) pyrophosphoryl-undecaprenol N-acetylglucosamine transferase [Stella humosa]
MTTRIVLAAGGTGGHLFPAEALARALLARGAEPILVTDPRTSGFAADLPGLAIHRLPLQPMRGGVVGRIRGGLGLCAGTLAARGLLRRLRPDAIVGFGGYPSVPTVFAGRNLGQPILLHEQNAVLGRANRMLASRATRIATSFARIRLLDPALAAKVVETGNPVRPAIAALNALPYQPPEDNGPVTVLVTGGSQGASVFATRLPDAIGRLPAALRARLHLVQQARAEDVEPVRAAYAAIGVAATVARFFDDMPARLGQAHLMISRSGASTVAEIAAAGRPALLVPYPRAADDHQTDNARHLADAGAAWMAPEGAGDAADLARLLEDILTVPDKLASAAARARGLGRPDAAERLADAVLALVAQTAPMERAA